MMLAECDTNVLQSKVIVQIFLHFLVKINLENAQAGNLGEPACPKKPLQASGSGTSASFNWSLALRSPSQLFISNVHLNRFSAILYK
jgi:hypothetical protein